MKKHVLAVVALCSGIGMAAETAHAGTVTVAGTNPCGAAHIDYEDGTAHTYTFDHLPTSRTHVYDRPGTYTIHARGTGHCDGEATTTVTVSAPLAELRAAPEITAVDMAPTPGRIGAPVTITVSGSGACAYEVQYGDGNMQEGSGALPQQYRHTYARPDRYTVIVKPNPPCRGTFSQALQVVDPATQTGRIAGIVLSPTPGVAGQPMTVTVNGVSGCAGYTLDYGDGNTEQRAAALPDVVKHVFPAPGRYVISATAVPPCTGRARAPVEVRTSAAPAAPAAPRIARLVLSPAAADPGQPVTITVEGTGACEGYTLDYGDGNSESRSGTLPDRAQHVYGVPGRYVLTAVARGSCSGDVRAPLDVRGRRRR
jgi:hypothetical protein